MMAVSNKRVMLIEPPFYRLYHDNRSLVRYPLSLGYLSGAALKWTDWEVQAYNADFKPRKAFSPTYRYLITKGFSRYLRTLNDSSADIWAEIRRAIADFNPDVVGITAKTQNFTSATRVARIAKSLNPDTLVITGGPHATLSTENALTCPDIDIAVRGEGEMTLVELLNARGAGKPLENIAGTAYRRGDRIVFAPPRTNMLDLDELPFPAESAPQVLRGYEHYPVEAFKFVFSARGCPFSCTFCESKAIWTQKTRWRSPENVVQELKALQERGVKYVRFEDDTFGIQNRYIKDLCTLMEAELPDLRWGCEITVAVSKEASVEYMRRAGCIDVTIGVESGNNEMLRKIKKAQTIEKAYAAARLYREKGIEIRTLFMIGLPEETEETLQDTVTAIKNIETDNIMLSVFTPYPGSEIFEECKELGVVDDDFDITYYNHHSPENCFTAYIPPERFRELVKEVAAIVDRRNDRAKLRRAWYLLRKRGLLHITRKCARYMASRVNVAWAAPRSRNGDPARRGERADPPPSVLTPPG